MNYFSKNIRFLLLTFDLSRDEFANVIGKKRSIIGSYIRGEAQPSLNILLQIAKYFGIDLNILVTLDLEKKLKNKKMSNIRQLHNFLFDQNESKNVTAEIKKKTFEREKKIYNEHENLKYEFIKFKYERNNILNEISKLQNRIDELYSITKNPNSGFKYFNSKNIALFSILLVVLFVLYFGLNHITSLRGVSEDDIFNRYYRPYKEDIYKNNNYRLSKIKEYYAYGNYYGVLNEFKEMYKSDSLNLEKYFYKGLVYLELSQFQSAIESFTKILLIKNNKYSDESRWYLGLCYLKIGQKVKAKNYFEEILNMQRYKRNEAREILQKLKL